MSNYLFFKHFCNYKALIEYTFPKCENLHQKALIKKYKRSQIKAFMCAAFSLKALLL